MLSTDNVTEDRETAMIKALPAKMRCFIVLLFLFQTGQVAAARFCNNTPKILFSDRIFSSVILMLPLMLFLIRTRLAEVLITVRTYCLTTAGHIISEGRL